MQPSLIKEKFTRIIEWSFFIVLVVFFTIKILKTDDYSWDVVAYHLPFTALKSGILDLSQYSMSPHLSEAYLGFPDFIYYIKGGLWSLTGDASSVNLVNIFTVFTFCFFCLSALNIRFFWSFVSLLSIPILHVAIAGGMVDFTANVFLAICMISLLLLMTKERGSRSLLCWFYISAFLAAGVKAQAIPFVGLMLCVFFLFGFLQAFSKKEKYDFRFWSIFIVVSLIIMYKPIANLFIYGNPLYPVKISVFGFDLPGIFVPIWPDPQYLASYPQPVRWILSVLEYDAFSMRPIPYTVDQGEVPTNARSFRMGGYNGFLVLFSITVLIFIASKTKSIFVYYFIAAIALVAAIISLLPGSNELRYYSFWMIFLVVSTLYICEMTSAAMNDDVIIVIKKLYKSALVICLIYFMMITGGRYQSAPTVNYEGFGVDRIASKIEMDDGYCIYGDESRFAILVAIEMNLIRKEKIKIYQRQSLDACQTPNLLEK